MKAIITRICRGGGGQRYLTLLIVFSLLLVGNTPCLAAPGDTVQVITNYGVKSSTAVARYGVRTVVGQFVNNTYGPNVWVSFVQQRRSGWAFYHVSPSGTRYGITGTIRTEIRKNDPDKGPLIWDETITIPYGNVNSGEFSHDFGPAGEPLNVVLKSGESLYWVVTASLTHPGTRLDLTPEYLSGQQCWKISFWKVDALVQESVNYAQDARLAAEDAKNAANTAATNALSAKTSADAAASRTIYNGQSAAYWAYQASQAAQTPTITKVQGLNNATCTRSSSFSVVVDANNATEFRACVDGGTWTNWVPIGSTATVTGLSGTGARTIRVEVRNAAGAVATGQMTVFKL